MFKLFTLLPPLTLFSLFILFILFKLLYTGQTVAYMPIYNRTLLEWANVFVSKKWSGWVTRWVIPLTVMATRAPAVLKILLKDTCSKH